MVISINLDERLNKVIRREAALLGCSRSYFIRLIIEDYLRRNNEDYYNKILANKLEIMEDLNNGK